MLLLVLFAFVSGLVTIFAPCIWPLLPLILSTTATGGHRKPLGITLGILISFAVLTLSISYIVKLIPFDPNLLRYFAVIVIAFLGLTLIIPAFSARLEALVSRISGKVQTGTPTSNGFWPGFLTGATLGIVWAPCAGPILATIAALAATQAVSFNVILVTIAYIVGIGIPLFAFATLGRTLFTRSRSLSKYTGRIQQIFGVIMLLTAGLIATNYDKVLEANLLNAFPQFSSSLNNFESNPLVTQQLNALKNKTASNLLETNGLFNTNYPAPDFAGATKWLNTDAPLSIADLKGKVVLVDFWTYTCINCIRTLPHVTHWYDKYKDQGFVVIGVHTPEFEFEKDTNNVLQAIKQYNIYYPVPQDNDYAVWNSFNNEYWPAEYLIDVKGNVRRTHFGEGEYDQTEEAIQQLLKEAGKSVNAKLDTMPDQTPHDQLSPETYLGAKRAQYYDPNGTLSTGKQNFSLSEKPQPNSFSLGGEWTIDDENAVAGKNATLTYNFTASKVFLVLSPSAKQNSQVKVYLDGKPVSVDQSGQDVHNGIVTVNEDRLYNLIDLQGKNENHVLKLEFQTPGTEGFAFTFG